MAAGGDRGAHTGVEGEAVGDSRVTGGRQEVMATGVL